MQCHKNLSQTWIKKLLFEKGNRLDNDSGNEYHKTKQLRCCHDCKYYPILQITLSAYLLTFAIRLEHNQQVPPQKFSNNEAAI